VIPSLAIAGTTIAIIVVVLIVDLFAILFGLSFMRSRREEQRAREAAASGLPIGESRGPKPLTRRDFFRRSLLTSLTLFGAQFGAATIAFLWPNLKGGFGSVINAGNINDVKSQIQSTKQPFYVGVGRFYLVPYSGKPTASENDYEALGVAAQGLMPLYQRCVHLGCRVPFCQSSQWFECPCHGSKYNEAGEYELGPAPRGMDRFRIQVGGDGTISVDTSIVVQGPPRGTDTISQPPQGSFCVAPG
jgi:cytochrome b6-f complex iron-sulfur subunit